MDSHRHKTGQAVAMKKQPVLVLGTQLFSVPPLPDSPALPRPGPRPPAPPNSTACISREPLRLSLFGEKVTSALRWPLKCESRRVVAVGSRREAGFPLPGAHVSQEAEAQRGREGCSAVS